MALHQFKTKHNSMCKAKNIPVDDSPGLSATEDNPVPVPPKKNFQNIAKRSCDPILLYKPNEFIYHPVIRHSKEDLFSACHNDLLRESSLSPSPSPSHSTDSVENLSGPSCSLDAGRFEHPTLEYPVSTTHYDISSPIKPHTSRPPKKKSSWSRRRNEYRMGLPSQSSYMLSPKESTTRNGEYWEHPGFHTDKGPLEAENLQLYHQAASHLQYPAAYQVDGEHLPIHLLNREVAYERFRESLLMAGQHYPTHSHEFDSTKRMLVEGLKIVCDEARGTMARMKQERIKEAYFTNKSSETLYNPAESDESYGEVAGKLNYIQSIIVQLANCSDPEILDEARRIIPVDLLQRLLQQVQGNSSEIQGPSGML